MKVIDVLNKIANGEEVRFKIGVESYHCYNYSNLYDELAKIEVKWYISEDWLNEEVEIIEEDKKIKRIGKLNQVEDKQNLNNYMLRDKINEIIDYINKGDK